jgi:F-type H+-transporting ATPase subunit b
MHIDWWTLALQAVNAGILIWLLARFLFKPVAGIIARRQEEAARLLQEAQAARASVAAEGRKLADLQAALAADRSAALDKAAAEAKTEGAKIIADAQAETARLHDAATEDIRRQKQASLAEAATEADRLALETAARLLQRLPEAAKVTAFIPGLVKALADLPAVDRAGLAGETVIRLIAPRPLTAEEIAACQAALDQALGRASGHPLRLDIVADTAVIAGLELEAAHVLVRNSFRNDLTQIANLLGQRHGN